MPSAVPGVVKVPSGGRVNVKPIEVKKLAHATVSSLVMTHSKLTHSTLIVPTSRGRVVVVPGWVVEVVVLDVVVVDVEVLDVVVGATVVVVVVLGGEVVLVEVVDVLVDGAVVVVVLVDVGTTVVVVVGGSVVVVVGGVVVVVVGVVVGTSSTEKWLISLPEPCEKVIDATGGLTACSSGPSPWLAEPALTQ